MNYKLERLRFVVIYVRKEVGRLFGYGIVLGVLLIIKIIIFSILLYGKGKN